MKLDIYLLAIDFISKIIVPLVVLFLGNNIVKTFKNNKKEEGLIDIFGHIIEYKFSENPLNYFVEEQDIDDFDFSYKRFLYARNITNLIEKKSIFCSDELEESLMKFIDLVHRYYIDQNENKNHSIDDKKWNEINILTSKIKKLIRKELKDIKY